MDDIFRFLFKDKKERKKMGLLGGGGAGECQVHWVWYQSNYISSSKNYVAIKITI
jgi:hypothetical protein